MRSRPLGITAMSLLLFLNAAAFGVLTALSLVSPTLLNSVLHSVSPGGAGPEPFHRMLGPLLPIYYLLMTAVVAALGVGFWRLWNWTRIVVLAMNGVSAVLGLVEVANAIRSGSGAALALTAVRYALIVLVSWYLLSRTVRTAFHPA